MVKMGRPTDNPRTKFVGIRLTKDEKEMLDYCMENLGLSISDIVRNGIREIYRKRKEKEI